MARGSHADRALAVQQSWVRPLPLRRLRPTARVKGVTHLVIPDTQLKPGAPVEHMRWIGEYAAERRPDVIVHLGDGMDNRAVSTYESPLEREGASIADDLACWKDGLAELMAPIRRVRGWKPRLIYTTGNHDNRLDRYIGEHPETRGLFGPDPYGLKAAGWEVHPFLKPVEAHGVWYAHFYPRGPHGKVTQNRNGAPNALAMVKREMRSCVAGHLQGLDVAILHAGGRTVRGIIAGSAYLHQESYLTPQGNDHWHGVLVLHEVHDGNFDVMEVSLDYLARRFSGGRRPKPWLPR